MTWLALYIVGFVATAVVVRRDGSSWGQVATLAALWPVLWPLLLFLRWLFSGFGEFE